uniref:Uncharacterized protein n=1 Tax=Myripristis murdjan TaxID=586833 RepID=A0A667ZN70_9TELE
MPRHQSSGNQHVTTPDNYAPPVSNYLPLEIFDNEDYDCRTPEDWLSLGYDEGSPDRKPIPAKALLPTTDKIPPDDPKSPSLKYDWHFVGVLEYSKEKGQYLVQKTDKKGRLTDHKGKPVLNGGYQKGVTPMLKATQYWVPRIRLLFSAEDPRVFAQRVQFAQHSRENAEALILYKLSVDCMPIWSGNPSLDTHSLEHIKKSAFSTPGPRLESLPECVGHLEEKVKLEYDRTINRIIFDKVVMSHPEEFSHITLPKKDPECVPQKGASVLYWLLHLNISSATPFIEIGHSLSINPVASLIICFQF